MIGDTIDKIFKDVVVIENSTVNIDSTKNLKLAGYDKTYNELDDRYIFRNEESDDTRVYQYMDDGLYHFINNEYNIMSIVKVSDKVGRVHSCLGHPNWIVLEKLIKNDIFTDSDIRINEIHAYVRSHSKCLSCLAGKSTRPRDNGLDNLNKINYDEEEGYTLFGDIFYLVGKA